MQIKISNKWLLIGSVAAAFFIGYWAGGDDSSGGHSNAAARGEVASVWTCSMHPQVRQPGPGQCPVCGMDLIPLSGGSSAAENANVLELSPYARKLAEVQVAPVVKRFVETEIRMVGKIDYDETQLGYITAWVPGRIDRMYVDYTGIAVRAGDHMVDIYSPDLVATQQELIQTLRSAASSNSAMLQNNLRAIRERLRLWGLTAQQIEKIAESGEIQEKVTIYAPAGGIVIEKNGLEGMYVETGTKIYTIANLSKVWVHLEAYERDILWIRYGQKVEFETEAYPGEVFTGRIAFIDPILDEPTRTVMVRVNVKNDDLRLKPGMLVRAVAKSQIAAGGKVIEPDLSGKWICPMHPEVVAPVSGNCDVCGMALARVEDMGYVKAGKIRQEASLVIPATAPLITGKRAVVYVQMPGEPGRFEGREVELGPRAGDYYIVKSGLREGDLVVTNGNFKIDSAIQIRAGSSMMNPILPDKTGPPGERAAAPGISNADMPEQFLTELDPVYQGYLDLQFALSRDRPGEAKTAAKILLNAARRVATGVLSGSIHQFWMDVLAQVKRSTETIAGTGDIAAMRREFRELSGVMIDLARHAGSSGKQPLLLYHCPMAFNNEGADWLQNKSGTENPYYGSRMFKCGTEKADLTHGDVRDE